MPTEFEAGQIIFRLQDPANGFYLIETGTVVLVKETSDGELSLSIPFPLVNLSNGWSLAFLALPLAFLMRFERVRHAPPFVFLVQCCGSIATTI